MADKWPLANGNWSSAANWNGGTKPVAGDDVYADGRTLNVDESFTVATLRTTQRSGGTIGGSFVFNTAGVTGDVTSATQAFFIGANNMITVTAASGNITLNSTVNQPYPGFTFISYTGNCNFNLTSNTITLVTTANNAILISKTSLGTLSVTSNLVGTNSGSGTYVINSNAGNTIIVGNITGALPVGSAAILQTGAGSLTVTGNVTGSGGPAIDTRNTVTTINGNVTAGLNFAITTTSATNQIIINGNVTASATANAISSTAANGQVYLNGNMVNNNGKMAIYAPIVWLDANNTTSAAFFTSGGSPRTLYSEDTVPNTPAVNNVRSGTIYGAGNTLVGTIVMPTAANVRNGVVYDNGTTGTALFTTSLFLTELSSSTVPVAVRMQNLCTPMILGELMEAFKK
jgi:hypothetical protein